MEKTRHNAGNSPKGGPAWSGLDSNTETCVCKPVAGRRVRADVRQKGRRQKTSDPSCEIEGQSKTSVPMFSFPVERTYLMN